MREREALFPFIPLPPSSLLRPRQVLILDMVTTRPQIVYRACCLVVFLKEMRMRIKSNFLDPSDTSLNDVNIA